MKKSAVGFLIVFSAMAVGCTSKEEKSIGTEDQAVIDDVEMKQLFGDKTPEEMKKENDAKAKESMARVIENNEKQTEERKKWEEKVAELGGMEEEYVEITHSLNTEGFVANVIGNINKAGETVKMPVELNDILGSGDVVIVGTSVKNGDVLMVTRVYQDYETKEGEYKFDRVIYRKSLE